MGPSTLLSVATLVASYLSPFDRNKWQTQKGGLIWVNLKATGVERLRDGMHMLFRALSLVHSQNRRFNPAWNEGMPKQDLWGTLQLPKPEVRTKTCN